MNNNADYTDRNQRINDLCVDLRNKHTHFVVVPGDDDAYRIVCNDGEYVVGLHTDTVWFPLRQG